MSTLITWTRRRQLSAIAAVLLVSAALAAYAVHRSEQPQAVELTPLPKGGQALAPALPQIVVTYRDTPPEMVRYSPGRHSGPLRYVIEEAANRIHYGINWQSASFGESVDQVIVGKIDIAPNARFKTAEREKTMRFSVSLGKVPSTINFLIRKDNPAIIETLADLRGHTVGYRRSVYYFQEFETAAGFKKIAYTDDKSMVKGFGERVVDVLVVNNKRGIERALAAGGINLNNYRYVDLVVEEEADVFLLYSRAPEKQKMFDQLDQALSDMKAQGVITDIYKSFDADPPDSNPHGN